MGLFCYLPVAMGDTFEPLMQHHSAWISQCKVERQRQKDACTTLHQSWFACHKTMAVMSKFYFSRSSLAPQAVHRRSFEYASEWYGGWCFLGTWDCLQGAGLRDWAAWVCNETFELPQAAQTITKHFGSSHTALLLPPLEEARFGQLMSCRNACKVLWSQGGGRFWSKYTVYIYIYIVYWSLMILTFSCHVGFPLDQGVFDVAWLIRHGAVQLMGQLPHPQWDHHPLWFGDAFFMSGVSQNWMTLQIRQNDSWMFTDHTTPSAIYIWKKMKYIFLGGT